MYIFPKMLRPVLIWCFLANAFVFSSAQYVTIQTSNGLMKGDTRMTRTGTKYARFLGVRYAQAPIEELRFEPPKPVEPWQGVYDATYEKGICYQVPRDDPMETEDCLMLNLFTPKKALNDTSFGLPVMVYIHGGGFVEGSGVMEWGIGPNFFVDNDIILLAINYRCGPFGFLSTGDEVIPGNLGLRDQIESLKWVQKNIKVFGGDPDKVTIFGQSAGGASVSYLTLTPLAKGLFRGAISQSGSSLCPWAYQRDQINITYRTAGLLNADFNKAENWNSTNLSKFLKSVPAADIDQASYNLTEELATAGNIQLSKGFYYTPVIEFPDKDAVLSGDLMFEKWQKGEFAKVPTMIGVNSEESLFMMNEVFERTLTDYDHDHKLIVPFDMHIADEKTKQIVGDLIKQNYTQNVAFENNTLAGVQYHSNQDFDKGVIKQAELQASYAPVWFYEFTHRGPMNNNPKHLNGTTGVSHGDESNYIFSRWFSADIPDNSDLSKFPELDRVVHYRLMALWVNFARHLNPTPEKTELLQNITWPTVPESGPFKYLEISDDLILHNEFPKSKMYAFWNELYETYGVKPYDSY